MLYQTHHPFFFQFHPFTAPSILNPCSPTTSSCPSVSLVSYPGTHFQAETEMECVEAALKTSFRKEMALKSSPQAFLEDMCVLNVQSGATCDDFFVDDLLDFSNQDALVEEEEEEYKAVSVSPQQGTRRHEISNPCSTFSAKDDFGSLPTSELSVPADELADLEWLSHFVEDSFSEHSAAYAAGALTKKPNYHAIEEDKCPEPETAPDVSTKTCFNTPVPAKARSKRARTGVRVWSLGSPSLAESSSSSTSSSSSCSPPGHWLIYTSSTTQNSEPVSSSEAAKSPVKKPKKKTVTDWSGTSTGSGGSQAPRRCSHCGVQKTPQWRAGPLGAKTLCNACGVRYKSGRLLPEYRPACSPTFSTELHSNHHRKVLEMRRKKELTSGLDSDLTAPVVPSF